MLIRCEALIILYEVLYLMHANIEQFMLRCQGVNSEAITFDVISARMTRSGPPHTNTPVCRVLVIRGGVLPLDHCN